VIVSPSFTSTNAWRNEPEPLSLVLVTVMVSAWTPNAATQSSNSTMSRQTWHTTPKEEFT
jgi:hypothetical protein